MSHRIATKAVAAIATAVAAIGIAALPANADDPLKLGSLSVLPTSGKIDTGLGVGWLTDIWTDEGEVCPDGFNQNRTTLYGVMDGVLDVQAAAPVMRKGIVYGGKNSSSLDPGQTQIYREGEYAGPVSALFPWGYLITATVTMHAELRAVCHNSNSMYDTAVHPYYSIFIDIEPDGSWHVLGGSAPVDSSESDINVDVPTALSATPTGLKISVKPGPATLTGASTRAVGQVWQATGTLDNVTVNDDRRDSAAADWTLNGQASDFTSATTSDTIPATNLGWTPAKVSGQGAAGSAVAIGTGLATDKELASGQASNSIDVTTTVNAALALDVPASVAAGSYKSTLTLTLI